VYCAYDQAEHKLDASQIASTAFDPQNHFLFSSNGIGLQNFGAGIASSEIGDAKIGTKQIGTVAQKFRFIVATRSLSVPAVFQITQACFDCHMAHNLKKFLCRLSDFV